MENNFLRKHIFSIPLSGLPAALLVWLPNFASAQDHEMFSETIRDRRLAYHAFVIIRNIQVEGNKSTKTPTILRELDFKPGDTVALFDLVHRLQANEYNLMNTGLFTKVRIYYKNWIGATSEVSICVAVRETWYIYPVPIFELADRNFNVWWEDYERSLRRLNFGMRFYHNNLSGHRDWLKAVVQVGFTKKYELEYHLPAFNRLQTLGLNIRFLHTREKEIGYQTFQNELLFHRFSEAPLLQRFQTGIGLLLRPRLNAFHRLNLSYHHNFVHESIRREWNPDFFLNSDEQKYLSLGYQFTYDKRDIKPYPMKGSLLEISASYNGFPKTEDYMVQKPYEALDVSTSFHSFHPLHGYLSIAYQIKGKMGLLRHHQPYYQSTALGYFNDFIRGYERYVVDGLDYFYFKNVLRLQLLDKSIHLGRAMPVKAYQIIPLRLFLSCRQEVGYVNNPFYSKNNPLSNQWLLGLTIGLDVIANYDKVFHFELSRNHRNEYGFFLHWAFSF